MGDITKAIEKLEALSPEEVNLVLDALEAERKERFYCRYWSSDPDPQYKVFFDSIEEDFSKFTSDIKIYALLGGNRSSKTERGAFLAVAWLFGKNFFRDEPSWRYVKDLPIPDHGVTVWAVGLDFGVIQNVIWKEKLRNGHRHGGLLPKTPSPYITRVTDSQFQVDVEVDGRKSTLICKSADSGAEKFQSASVDLVWIDEECDESVYNECFQRTVDCAGKIVITLTPLSDVSSGVNTPWVYDLFQEWKSGRKDLCFISLDTLANPFIPDEEKVRLKEKWAGHPEERARLYGEFIRRAGLVYPQWNRSVHLVKPINLPRDWRRIASIDPAATGITACVWAAIHPNNDVYIYRVYYEKDLIVSDHAKNILVRNAGDPISLWLLDPFWGCARNAETHKTGQDLYRQAGLPVRLAPRAEDYGVNTLAEYLSATTEKTSRHPKLFVFDNDSCKPFISEIEGYTWDTIRKGPNKGLNKDKPRKGNDHAINATQYMLSLNPRGYRHSFTTATTNPNLSYT
jgi:phage terminase large subunit-like protein